MPCSDCAVSREYVWFGRMFDSLKCVFCAARLIQLIGTFQITPTECAKRRRLVLADSMAAGLDEAQIRALVKGPMAIEPEIPKDKPRPKKKRVVS